MKTIEIPELALVVLIGASGSGKSSFARKHFLPTEILSSDYFRGLVSDDENNQAATYDAFDALYYLLDKRLSRAKLTVIDATNVRIEDRKRIIEHARKFHCLAVAIVLNTPEAVCHDRNRNRSNRDFGPHVVRRQVNDLRRSMRGLEREGFRYVHILTDPEDISITRVPLYSNKKHVTGPFDIIGDVHGCAPELRLLLTELGYQNYAPDSWQHPEGRKAIFVGDLVDRGPEVVNVIRIVQNMIGDGHAFCVAGNHDVKLVKWLRGKDVQIKHGLAQSIAELEPLTQEQRTSIASFLDGLVGHYVFDNGNLVVAHAGLREEMHGRASAAVRAFGLFGETTGETDEYGLPVRFNWAAEYRGRAMVVYGHTPIPKPEWLNNTVNIDTGAVFGGKLTALRYPEREFISVPAAREYATPIRPISPVVEPILTAQQQLDDVLDLADVTGKRIIETRFLRNITVREENSIAALEVMSRFAIDPRWLIYLPPTMSPCETATHAGYLEYPTEAFSYYRKQGVETVVCEEKHMGSRAVVVVCRTAESAQKRFGVTDGRLGICYTRTGRAFFNDATLEASFISRISNALTAANFWEEFNSNWFCLDCELMPWSAKARELLERQYAAVGASGEAALSAACQVLSQNPAASALAIDFDERLNRLKQYRAAYRRYCWPVNSLDDYRLAPFHLLASEGEVHDRQTNSWHMQTLHRLAALDPDFLLATPYREVNLADEKSVDQATAWWEELTGKGGEGMVVKSQDFLAQGPKGIIQPAIKCRGREYLRIIYGAEYDAPNQLPRLRARNVGSKRSLASREFSLGLESLHRFVDNQPLRKVHECVFAVLALESEPVDPRL